MAPPKASAPQNYHVLRLPLRQILTPASGEHIVAIVAAHYAPALLIIFIPIVLNENDNTFSPLPLPPNAQQTK